MKSKRSGGLTNRSSNLEMKIAPFFLKKLKTPIRADTLKALPIKQNLIAPLLRYRSVLAQGRHLGLPVTVRFIAGPGRSPKITSVDVEKPASKQEDVDLQNALATARERGQHRAAEILSGQDMLNAKAFASLLNTTPPTINSWRKAHQVLALKGAKRGFRFPEWQIDRDGKPFGALPKLFKQLGNDPWAVYRFFIQHHPELDGLTGHEALEEGMTSEAIEAAESVARGAA